MIEIKRIRPEQTYALRHRILRPHQDIEDCRYPGDFDSTTAHFGAICSEEIVGILSVYKINHDAIDISDSWQLRAMATAESVRGKGYGAKLIEQVESAIANQDVQCIWANARINAVGFYQNLNYSIVGSEFDIPDVGPHQLVYKKITLPPESN